MFARKEFSILEFVVDTFASTIFPYKDVNTLELSELMFVAIPFPILIAVIRVSIPMFNDGLVILSVVYVIVLAPTNDI
jgi:hypothetical protein